MPTPSEPSSTPRSISRRALLGGAAVTGLAGVGLTGAISSPATAAPTADSVTVDGLRITKIADLTGPEITGRFGVGWADLGISARCPDGRTLYVFGDTFGPTGARTGAHRRRCGPGRVA